MNIKKIARDCYCLRYFFTVNEYFNKNNITDANIQKLIKIELLEIEKEEEQKEILVDTLLKSMKAFRFIESTNKSNYMIYTKSIKETGFQLTFFYNNEPVSDIIRDTIPAIKDEILNYISRYSQLDSAIGKLA